jgi:hypothetical protein
MDDIRPLEELTTEAQSADMHLFSIRPALEFYYLPGSVEYSGKDKFKAPNPPFGTYISFYLKSYAGEEYSINITDSNGKSVRKLTGPTLPEFNRVIWNLQPDGAGDEGGGGGGGGQPRLVKPGEYTVTLTVGDKKATQKVLVEAVEGLKIE